MEALAQFLVSLLSNTHRVINNEQAKQLIHLWNDLPPYDTMHTRFAHRFQTSLISGRFKQPKQKRLEMTPGVDSVKR